MIEITLNHLHMVDIYEAGLDETDINLTTNRFIKEKKFRIFTFGLYQLWPFFGFNLLMVATSLTFFSMLPFRIFQNH